MILVVRPRPSINILLTDLDLCALLALFLSKFSAQSFSFFIFSGHLACISSLYISCNCLMLVFAVGLDLAYIYNGYVYHTEFDRPEMIPAGSIQQAGRRCFLLHFYTLSVTSLLFLKLETGVTVSYRLIQKYCGLL